MVYLVFSSSVEASAGFSRGLRIHRSLVVVKTHTKFDDPKQTE